MAISRRKKLLRESKLKMYSSALKRAKRFSSSIVIQEFKEYVPCRSPLQLVNASKVYPSYEGTIRGNTNKKERPQYSGDYVTGLATLHKSNIVPVGKNDNPVDYATMRRN